MGQIGLGIEIQTADAELYAAVENGSGEQGAARGPPPSPLCPTLHSDQFELAQFSGTLVWGIDWEKSASRQLCKRARSYRGY